MLYVILHATVGRIFLSKLSSSCVHAHSVDILQIED